MTDPDTLTYNAVAGASAYFAVGGTNNTVTDQRSLDTDDLNASIAAVTSNNDMSFSMLLNAINKLTESVKTSAVASDVNLKLLKLFEDEGQSILEVAKTVGFTVFLSNGIDNELSDASLDEVRSYSLNLLQAEGSYTDISSWSQLEDKLKKIINSFESGLGKQLPKLGTFDLSDNSIASLILGDTLEENAISILALIPLKRLADYLKTPGAPYYYLDDSGNGVPAGNQLFLKLWLFAITAYSVKYAQKEGKAPSIDGFDPKSLGGFTLVVFLLLSLSTGASFDDPTSFENILKISGTEIAEAMTKYDDVMTIVTGYAMPVLLTFSAVFQAVEYGGTPAPETVTALNNAIEAFDTNVLISSLPWPAADASKIATLLAQFAEEEED